MSKRISPEEFEARVKSIFGDQAELLTPFTKTDEKVLVRFTDCGHEQWKIPHKLLAGQGCGHRECHNRKIGIGRTKTVEQFQKELDDKGYQYEVLSDYNGIAEKITVKNLKCGHTYSARAGNILRGSGCPVCHGMKNTEEFKEELESLYPNEFTILGEYINNRTKILTRHNKCGYEWEVTPKSLLRHYTCPYCNKSLGEYLVEQFLIKHNVDYKCQYTFEDCRDLNKLPFDFAVFINGEIRLIEFDGTQHFDGQSKGWNNPDHHSKVAMHDIYKNAYCTYHKIPLLRIPYWRIRSFEKDLAKFLDIKL